MKLITILLLLPFLAQSGVRKTIPVVSGGGIYFTNNGFLQPGDTGCIKAGFYPYISLDGIVGTKAQPIVIINCGGQVVCSQPSYCYRFVNSRFFKFTGTGDSTVLYGFKAGMASRRSGSGINIKENCSDWEVEFYEAHKVENGFLCKIDPYDCLPESWFPNFFIENVSVHDCWVHDTGGEGLYLVNTAQTATVKNCAGQVITVETVMGRNYKVYDNVVDSTGWDGIQVAATTNALIYGNVVTNYGMKNMGSQQAGIILGGKSNGAVYNNFISTGTGEGLEVFGYGEIMVYNNIIINAGHDGTPQGQDGIAIDDRPQPNNKYTGQLAQVINNTVVRPGRNAIHLYNSYGTASKAGHVYNNILVEPGNPSPYDDPFINLGIAADTSNNLRYKKLSDAGFIDTLNDFRLITNVDGRDISFLGVTVDYNNAIRTLYSIGAYEEESILPPPVPIPPIPPKPTISTAYYFSSSDGDDSRTATEAMDEATPWKTTDKLNSIFPLLTAADTICFKSGDVFPVYKPITPTRNGSAVKPIVFTTYGTGLQPIFTALESISGWIDKGNGIYESTPIRATSMNIVKVNGKIQAQGRYPNIGWLTFESHTGNSITDNQLTTAINWAGAQLVVKPKRWVIDRRTITAHTGGTLSFGTPLTYIPYDNYGYFMQNSLKALDSLGEWYYNTASKTLSMFFGAVNPDSVNVEASVCDTLVNLTRVSNLVFNNLSFIGANKSAFQIYYGQNIEIKNCSILYSGLNAINASSTNDFFVNNNYVDGSLNNGINLSYNCRRAAINYNLVSNTGLFAGSGLSGNGNYQGITVSGSRNTVSYNQIIKTGYIPIRFSGDSNVIQGNLIDTFAMVKDDAGGIYNIGDVNKMAYGNKITGNIILNGIGAPEGTDKPGSGSANGIYLDNYSNNTEISGNTVANCFNSGIFLHNAIATTLTGNTLYNNGTQLLAVHDVSATPAALLRNNIVKNNNFISKKNQLIFTLVTLADDISLLGVMDSNFYSRPEDMNLAFSASWLVNGAQTTFLTDLQGWKNKFGLDRNSKQGLPVIAITDSIVGGNLLPNGNFNTNISGLYSTPTSKWISGILDGGTFQGTTTAGFWQVIIKLSPVKAGKKYKLQFSSISSKDTLINAYIRLSSKPYTKLSDIRKAPLKVLRAENNYILTANASSTAASLVFDTKAKALTFWLDNIGLYETVVAQPDISTYYLFDYNFESQIKTIPLSGNYIDALGNIYTGSVNINPNSAVVLTKN